MSFVGGFPREKNRASSHAKRHTSPSGIDLLLPTLLLFGAYTTVSIFSDDTILVPSVISLISAAIILIRRLGWVDPLVLWTFGLIIGLCLFQTALLGVAGYIDVVKTLLPIANFACSLLTGYALFLALRNLQRRRLKQLLYWCWLFLLGASWAEVYLGLGVISDAFRHAVFPRYLYEAEMRDVILFGGVRPKVFSPEPSYVGVWFLALVSAWLTVPSRTSIWLEGAIAILATAMISVPLRSGTLVFVVPLVVCCVIYRNAIARQRKRINGRMMAVLIGMLVPSLALNVLDLQSAPAFMQGDSFYARMLAPSKVALSTFLDSPILGLGISNDPKMIELTIPEFSQRDLYIMNVEQIDNVDSMLANSFYFHWIYFGLILGCVIGYIYYRLFNRLTSGMGGIVIALTCIMWFTIGGYNNIQSWVIAFLFAASAAVRGAPLISEVRSRRRMPRIRTAANARSAHHL